MKARIEYDRSAGSGMTAVLTSSKQTVRQLTTLSLFLGGEVTRLHAVSTGWTTEIGNHTK